MAGIHDILADDLAAVLDSTDTAGAGEAVTHTAASGGAQTAATGAWLFGPSLERAELEGGGAEFQQRRGEFLLHLDAAAGVIAPALEDTLLVGGRTYAIVEILELHAGCLARCRVLETARRRVAGPNSRLAGPPS